MNDWKAKQAARALMAAALRAANPRLVPIGGKVDALSAAAKNIRIELAAAFPGIKFSVKSRRFSGGDAIDVRWIDGPCGVQVDAIIDRYESGTFDGMTDCAGTVDSAWMDAFGDARFVSGVREASDKAIESAIRYVWGRYGFDGAARPTAADFRAGRCWNVQPVSGNGRDDLCSLINRQLSRQCWALTKAAKANARSDDHFEVAG